MSDSAAGRIISVMFNSLFKVLEERTIFFLFYKVDVFLKKIFHQYEFLEGYLKIRWDWGVVLHCMGLPWHCRTNILFLFSPLNNNTTQL